MPRVPLILDSLSLECGQHILVCAVDGLHIGHHLLGMVQAEFQWVDEDDAGCSSDVGTLGSQLANCVSSRRGTSKQCLGLLRLSTLALLVTEFCKIQIRIHTLVTLKHT
jgi:hypothetical protein